ncbi:hypothetical protein AKJ65_07140 [candidate division MSBL1 archaeon SCGC-AAA259E19]|uniref:Uncharacterized protein n=1 Tax=candidate division MSBL1 archaeon SCGC-AAA259E19 TaxID=1698264 RepID=A0A133UEW1_9EURY|nr:hypothetical protein AKJ65_07140 [candidate division MSBL1 archaeon SCGC-AAA259E19]
MTRAEFSTPSEYFPRRKKKEILPASESPRLPENLHHPLEHDGGEDLTGQHRGSNKRTTEHFDGTACCPPDIARLLASLPGYVYGKKEKSLYVHLEIYLKLGEPLQFQLIHHTQVFLQKCHVGLFLVGI